MHDLSSDIQSGEHVKPEEILSSQYVTFTIDNEIYGIEVLKVQEIIGMSHITHVPNSIEFMKGVINLRGTVVPVLDMRSKFNMNQVKYDSFTVILIVEVQGDLIGMIVDSVSDVIDLPVEKVQDTPHFTSKIDTNFISAIGNHNETLIIMLDVDKMLTDQEFREITSEVH